MQKTENNGSKKLVRQHYEVLQELGDLVEAKAALERALGIFERFLPAGHPKIRTVRENLDSLGRGDG